MKNKNNVWFNTSWFCRKVCKKQLQQDLETILNILEKQKAEIEKKYKMIDLMAEEFEDLKLAYFKKEDGGEFFGKYRTYNKNEWKQYFKKKAEEIPEQN